MALTVQIAGRNAPSPAYGEHLHVSSDPPGLGTAHYGRGAGQIDEGVVEHVQNALKAGFTHLDNAEAYSNDVSVGEALRRSGADRSKLWITHKVTGVADIKSTLQKQLGNLGTDYVDLYLVHDPTEKDNAGLTHEAVWRQVEEIQKLGLAKAIGVSNHRVSHLTELLKTAKVKPAVNQIEDQNDELVAYCQQHGIVIEGYGGLAPLTRTKGGPVDDIVTKIAAQRGISDTQVLLLWAKRYIHNGVVITTSTKPERMAEQLAFTELEPLSDADFKAIAEAGRQKPSQRHFMTHTA